MSVFQGIRDAFSLPDLRRRILFTIGCLILYRLLANIPIPGVSAVALSSLADSVSGNALIDTLDLLSGGAVSNFSVMAMGVYPYITASIIIQLLTPIVPYLEELRQEGESGRNRINKITYYLTVPLALIQAIGQVNLIGFSYGSVRQIIPNWGIGNGTEILTTVTILFTMTAGAMFAIWLGERITEDGIGQGVSLIIFSGIVTMIPQGLFRILLGEEISSNVIRWVTLLTFIVLVVGVTYLIVKVNEGQRRIPVQYGRRVRGRKTYQGQSSYVPLKVNTAGMIPIIFAQSLLAFPGIIASAFQTEEGTQWYAQFAERISETFGMQQGWAYWIIYFLLVFAFTFFYTDVMVGQQKMHENLQRNGGFIPGIRPGVRTESYIKRVVRRITFVGAFFLSTVAIIPGIMQLVANLTNLQGLDLSALVVDGSGLIIVVGVVIDTLRQLESQLLMRNYEGFIS